MKKMNWVLIVSLTLIAFTGIVFAAGTDVKGQINIHAIYNLTPGGTTECSWDWSNLSGNVSVTLWKAGKLVTTFTDACPLGANGQGSLVIKIPIEVTPGTYELHVKSLTDPQVEGKRIVVIIAKSNVGKK
jgi:hypothetical protein